MRTESTARLENFSLAGAQKAKSGDMIQKDWRRKLGTDYEGFIAMTS